MAAIEKIVVFGATEKTGLEILKKGIAEDLEVTAFVRDSNRIPQDIRDKLKILTGDESNFEDVEKAVKGQDAVLSALDSTNLLEGCENIVKAMKEHDVTKLVVVSTAQLLPGRKPYFWGKRVDRHAKQLDILRQESDSIEWVAMMADRIKDSQKIEPDYKVEKNNTPGANEVTTAELADFMVKVFMDETSIECFRHTKLGISSRPKSSPKSFFVVAASAFAVAVVAVCMYYGIFPSLLQGYWDGIQN